MKSGRWQWLKRMPDVLAESRREPAEHARRQIARQRNIFLPSRLVVAAIVLFQFYNSRWLGDPVNPYGVIFETILNVIVVYALVVLAVTALFYVVKKNSHREQSSGSSLRWELRMVFFWVASRY